jgi:uncharacterized phage protein (TIGR01671 family)
MSEQRPYRGKRIDNGDWATGSLMQECDGKMHIVDSYLAGEYGERVCRDWHEVDPATVGQYTGLQDDQQVKVFLGDKVMDIFNGKVYTVIWDDIGAMFLFSPEGEDESEGHAIDYYEFEDNCSSIGFRVVGTRWDHPHLLKGDAE